MELPICSFGTWNDEIREKPGKGLQDSFKSGKTSSRKTHPATFLDRISSSLALQKYRTLSSNPFMVDIVFGNSCSAVQERIFSNSGVLRSATGAVLRFAGLRSLFLCPNMNVLKQRGPKIHPNIR